MVKNKRVEASQEQDVGAVHISEDISFCQQFLETYYSSELENIIRAEDTSSFHPLVIEASFLFNASPRLGNLLYQHPSKLFPIFDDAARHAQDAVFNSLKSRKDLVLKNIHVRVSVQGSALDSPDAHLNISLIRVKDMGRLLTIRGTVIRSGGVKMLEGERWYECTKCKHRFQLFSDLEMGNSFPLPSVCPSQRTEACDGQNFKYMEDTTVCHDYQEIKIQESMQALGVGSVPRSILVVLDDDLVDTIQAGDDVIVTGILFSKWKPLVKDVRCDLTLTLRANFIRKTNKLSSTVSLTEYDVQQFEEFWAQYQGNPLEGRNAILQGVCPQVFGLFTVKLSVALTLIGGVPHFNTSGGRVRGESHLLLVGDPGTGKSQFLKYAIKLSHRSVLTTGLGSTSAGLTVTAVKDGGEWMLEAGALVLADGGLCCIDEFDSIREADRSTIHEAMEQQTISVAKAGLVRTLNTRCTVFGVTNPKGQYDPYQSLCVNTTLSAPLLSRFDIVLVLLDTKNPEWDNIVSTHILSEHSKPAESSSKKDGFWTLSMLRSYLLYVRTKFKPVLTADAEKVIMNYYQLQRKSARENAARTTIRMLESLIRLAQAHARLMFRNVVLRADAIAAVICVESSMTSSAILQDVGNALHSTFADNPDEEYAKQEKTILAALQLGGMGSESPRLTDIRAAQGSGGEDEDCEHDCTILGTSDLDRVKQRRQSEATAAGEGPSSLGVPNAGEFVETFADRRDLGPRPSKQAKIVNLDKTGLAILSQNVLSKLKGRDVDAVSGERSAKNSTQHFTEELILSSQYSLP